MHCALMLPRWQNRSDMKLEWYVLTIVSPTASWHRVMAFNAMIGDRRSALLYNPESPGSHRGYITNCFNFSAFKKIRSLDDHRFFLVPLKLNNVRSLCCYSGYHIVVSTKMTLHIRIASWEIFACTDEAVGPSPSSHLALPSLCQNHWNIAEFYEPSFCPVRMCSLDWWKHLPIVFLAHTKQQRGMSRVISLLKRSVEWKRKGHGAGDIITIGP